jgi:hypothetical protein
MKPTGRELIDVLERIAALEWYRYPKYDSATSASVVWRFDSNQTKSEQIVQIIEEIRSALNVVVNNEWSLKYTGRNWVLAPVKVVQLEESGRFRTDGEVNSHIAQEEPDFFTKAHVDLVEIASAVAFGIKKRSNRGQTTIIPKE